jgi:hypothetical protein
MTFNNFATYMGQQFTYCISKPTNPTIGMCYVDSVDYIPYIFTASGWTTLSSVSTHIPPLPYSTVSNIREEELCKQHPGLADLKKELDKAKERFDMYKELCNTYYDIR